MKFIFLFSLLSSYSFGASYPLDVLCKADSRTLHVQVIEEGSTLLHWTMHDALGVLLDNSMDYAHDLEFEGSKVVSVSGSEDVSELTLEWKTDHYQATHRFFSQEQASIFDCI